MVKKLQKYENKLRASGLDSAYAKSVGLIAISSEETAALQAHYRETEALFIPYFDIEGQPTNYHRVRYLDESTFGTGRKYDCPTGHPPRAYFPRTLNWKQLKDDTARTLTITEGELKAVCAAKHRIACIGLGGVWSWKSKKLGVLFLPELEAFEWHGRSVELCFDSDITVKNQVRAALVALGRELAQRGATCRMVLLPEGTSGEKLGLDDYLVQFGVKAYQRLERFPILEDEAVKLEIFSNWIYVQSEDHVVDFSREEPIVYRSRAHFMNATQHLTVLNSAEKLVPAANVWYSDSNRQMVARRIFDPTSADRITYLGRAKTPCLNMYQGLDVEPRRGSVQPMLTLIDVLTDGRAHIRKWFLQWLAYPLQKPGTKLNQCVFTYSALQGVGKTALGEVMLDIYGRFAHGVTIEEGDFFGEWNSWIEMGLFALCDELSFDGSKKSRSAFKRAITGESMQLSAKYRAAQHIANRCNFYFTSNSPGGLPLEGASTNRRVLVLEINKEMGEKWFTTEFDGWRKNGGPSCWLWYLLNMIDIKGFNIHGNAPQTREVELAIESTGTTVENWIRQELQPGGLFAEKDIWSSRQIVALHESHMESQGSRSAGSAAISRGLAANRWYRYGQVRVGVGGRTEVLWLTPGAKAAIRRMKPKKLVDTWVLSHIPAGLDKVGQNVGE